MQSYLIIIPYELIKMHFKRERSGQQKLNILHEEFFFSLCLEIITITNHRKRKATCMTKNVDNCGMHWAMLSETSLAMQPQYYVAEGTTELVIINRAR